MVNYPDDILIDKQNRRQFLKEKTGLKFICFHEISAAKEYITKESKKEKIVIVGHLDMAREINELCYIEKIKHIYYHNIESSLTYDDFF